MFDARRKHDRIFEPSQADPGFLLGRINSDFGGNFSEGILALALLPFGLEQVNLNDSHHGDFI